MRFSADLVTGFFIGVLTGFGILLFFFYGIVDVKVYTCYQNELVNPYGKGLFCSEGQSGNPCIDRNSSSVYGGLVDYSSIKPYLVGVDDKVLNISLNEVK